MSPLDAVELIDASFGDVLPLEPALQQGVHRELAERRIAGGAVYDGMTALAASAHDLPLVTHDARARATYEAVGATVELIA